MNSRLKIMLTFLSVGLLIILYSTSCTKPVENDAVMNAGVLDAGVITDAAAASTKPNVIVILADDVGYEVPAYTGGQTYTTPNLDFLAASGTQFSQAHASPLCSPSRFMLMTGKYNFRNYFQWGVLGQDQRTLANLAKSAGYTTCASGKWQFDGGDQSIHTFGFDKYSVNEAFKADNGTEASNDFYKDPTIYQNGAYLPAYRTNGKYGPDMFRDYVFNFIDSNKDKPFFVYWAPPLCHKPYSPTPDDAAYASWVSRQKPQPGDSIYYPLMVKYMDKQIGQLLTKLQQMNLDRKTLIFFAADNGTPGGIHSLWNGKVIEGGKSEVVERGYHVPLLAFLPGSVPGGNKDTSLIDFTDFMTTLAGVFRSSVPASYGTVDGVSFYPQLSGLNNNNSRDWVFCHYQIHPDDVNGPAPKRWMQNTIYKEYDTIAGFAKATRFYNIVLDPEENYPIPPKNRTPEEKFIYSNFKKAMNTLH